MSRLTKVFLILAMLCLAGLGWPGPACAQWVPGGATLCQNPCGADNPRICSDGLGGAFIAWRDLANALDVYLQRVTTDGLIAPGWPPDGLPVCSEPSSQHLHDIAPDGEGGVFVAWMDFRNALTLGTGQDIYLQRVTASGQVYPGWPVNGVPVCRARRYQHLPEVVATASGEAIVTWSDERNDNFDVFAQRLLPSGLAAPGWPENGFPVCTLPAVQFAPSVVADGAGGALLFWEDLRDGTSDIYGIRLTPEGAPAPGWIAQGSAIAVGPHAQFATRAIPDGAGGAFVVWIDLEDEFGPSDLYAQRITGAGVPAAGWPAGGLPVAPAPDLQIEHAIAPDGVGGLLVAWSDYRNYFTSAADIYAQRLMPDGRLAPGWPPEGARVCRRPEFDVDPDIAPDGRGGAYVTYEGYAEANQVFVQHLTATGAIAPGWGPDGVPVSTAVGQFTPKIIADGAHGSIVAWENRPRASIYAQRFVNDGPVPVLLSLASAQATPERVELIWQGPGAGALAAEVERRTTSEAWRAIGTPSSDGPDRLRFEDRAVSAGERYAYRLRYVEEGAERFTAETWVEVPRGLELALEGFRPNPAGAGAAMVVFTLPVAVPARLEVMDVAGRRVLAREVGSLGAGRHVVRIEEAQRMSPGIYWLRLTQVGRVLTARGIVVR